MLARRGNHNDRSHLPPLLEQTLPARGNCDLIVIVIIMVVACELACELACEHAGVPFFFFVHVILAGGLVGG